MMREIDLLREAARRDLVLVEKDTNLQWLAGDLNESPSTFSFEQEDRISPPDPRGSAVSSIYPACGQQLGASRDYGEFTVVGQTRHFLLFGKRDGV